jgi:hypothetical protein
MATWEKLGAVAPRALVAARQELHWGARLVASAGASLLPARADDSHTSMRWIADARALVGEPLAGDRTVALRLADQTLLVLVSGRIADALALAGRTFADALAWLSGVLAAGAVAPPPHALPDHPLAHGARFGADPAALGELARWYEDAAGLLEEVQAAEGAGPVRCWPHHFDIATLLGEGTARTIGVGLSPGDEELPAPYLYVTPWPYPRVDAPPALAGGGIWHTAGWFGALLPGEVLAEGPEPAAQAARARAFVGSALAACKRYAAE